MAGRQGKNNRKMFRTAAAIVVVSRDMERRLIELGAPPEKVFWNPCGVDPELFIDADPAGRKCPILEYR